MRWSYSRHLPSSRRRRGARRLLLRDKGGRGSSGPSMTRRRRARSEDSDRRLERGPRGSGKFKGAGESSAGRWRSQANHPDAEASAEDTCSTTPRLLHRRCRSRRRRGGWVARSVGRIIARQPHKVLARVAPGRGVPGQHVEDHRREINLKTARELLGGPHRRRRSNVELASESPAPGLRFFADFSRRWPHSCRIASASCAALSRARLTGGIDLVLGAGQRRSRPCRSRLAI